MIRLIICLLCLSAPAAADRLEQLSDTRWRLSNREFGGLSGLHISSDGTQLLAITDRGLFISAVAKRSKGTITAITGTRITPIRQIDGKPVKDYHRDAEGLAVDRYGKIYVSFERFHRIRRYDSPTSNAVKIRGAPAFKTLQTNSGLEALAVDASGTLYAVPERSGTWERPFPVYRRKSGKWDQVLSLPRSKKFLPTDAAFGPDGRFYLLERDLAGILGFKTRIRRFTLGPKGFANETVLLESTPGTYDNLEGLSLWRDTDGGIRLTLVSDDNFFPFQKTQIVEFLLIED